MTTNRTRARELYEIGSEHDSAGREAEAVGPYREALALGLPPDTALAARIQLASTLRNLGELEESLAERYARSLRAYADALVERAAGEP